ncbi:MAG: hypothetical protein ACXAD7_01255 [Candidatus Kariarchaeaceae archaeon]|jgi:hypothetical protein
MGKNKRHRKRKIKSKSPSKTPKNAKVEIDDYDPFTAAINDQQSELGIDYYNPFINVPAQDVHNVPKKKGSTVGTLKSKKTIHLTEKKEVDYTQYDPFTQNLLKKKKEDAEKILEKKPMFSSFQFRAFLAIGIFIILLGSGLFSGPEFKPTEFETSEDYKQFTEVSGFSERSFDADSFDCEAFKQRLDEKFGGVFPTTGRDGSEREIPEEMQECLESMTTAA